MLDAVAVIATILILAVLQDGAQPDRAHPEALEVIEATPHAFERSTLKSAERLVPGAAGSRLRIVESIDKSKVDPAVTPVRRGWKRAGDLDVPAVHTDDATGRCACANKNIVDF